MNQFTKWAQQAAGVIIILSIILSIKMLVWKLFVKADEISASILTMAIYFGLYRFKIFRDFVNDLL
jgi:uncharacterized membrane protein YcjF (UPF0283 family)